MIFEENLGNRNRGVYSPVPLNPLAPPLGLDGQPVAAKAPTGPTLGGPGPQNPIDYNSLAAPKPVPGPTLGGPGPQNPIDYNSLQPKPVPGPTLGGPGPRNPMDYGTPVATGQPPMSTGYPPTPTGPTMQPIGGPAVQGPPATPGSLGLDFMRQVTGNELVENRLNNLLQTDSRYIQNARQRGAEYAASRGNINSSIGAGASERAALEAAMPIAESDAGVYRDANQGNFESLNQLRQMRTAAELDNWLSDSNFNRDFNGRLAMIPINSGADMLAYITQRALEDPAVYTPDVISGFNNFFNLNMKDMFKNFFGGGGP